MTAWVYILASRPGGALYVGATTDLRRRVEQHRAGAAGAHTARYGVRTLVWFEPHETLNAALARERSVKRWRRAWKDALIVAANPDWRDIADQIPF